MPSLRRQNYLMLSILISIVIFAHGIVLIKFAQAQDGELKRSRPSLYFKPPYHMLPDGTRGVDPVTLPQITTEFSAVLPRAATDVQLSIYWSELCPTDQEHCDFSFVDKALDYWKGQHKGVILAIQTVSYPTKIIRSGLVTFTSATPLWLMRSVQTYIQKSKIIGQPVAGSAQPYPNMDASFPLNWDPTFVKASRHLISELAKLYDGNPEISSFVMTFGLNGEDLTFPNMLGLNAANWIDRFEMPLVEQYVKSFRKTPLEFDLALLGFLNRKSIQSGGGDDQRRIDGFIQYLIKNHVLLSIQGLSSETLLSLNEPNNTSDPNLVYLIRAKHLGDKISLEAYQPLTGPHMRDLGSIKSAIEEMHPDRLGFFNPAVNGSSNATQTLLKDLGYK